MWDSCRGCQGPGGPDVLWRLASSNWQTWGMAWSFYSRKGNWEERGFSWLPEASVLLSPPLDTHPSIHVFGLGPFASWNPLIEHVLAWI